MRLSSPAAAMPGVWTPTPESDAHQLAHPHDDRHSLCLAVAILMPVVAVLVTGVRLACRQKLNARLSYDDFAIMVAVVSPAWYRIRSSLIVILRSAASR